MKRLKFAVDGRKGSARETVVYVDGEPVHDVVAVRRHKRRSGAFDTYVVFRSHDVDVQLPPAYVNRERMDIAIADVEAFRRDGETWVDRFTEWAEGREEDLDFHGLPVPERVQMMLERLHEGP